MATQVGHHTKEGERKIRFISNVTYDGAEYGPAYDKAEASVRADFAYQFVSEGRAIFIDDGPAEAVHDEETKAKAEADAKSRRK
jgi:hypothetical protein